MTWTDEHNVMLLREILLFEPWIQKHGSTERGQVWKRIAESLNQLERPLFRVDDRACRDHYKLLEKKFVRRINEEEKASGIAPEEETELDNAIRNAWEQFKEFDKKHNDEKQKKESEASKEIAVAQEFRNASLETFGQTRKRLNFEEDSSSSPRQKKSKSSTSETIAFLREKNESELELRRQELQIRKAELAEREKNQTQMYQFMQQQQQRSTQLMQQQQQVNLALVQFLNKFNPNN